LIKILFGIDIALAFNKCSHTRNFMNSGYYSAVGGMITQFNRLDVISNNLANINTTGFKRDEVVIGDFLRIYKESRDELPVKNHTRDGAKFLNRTINRVPHIVENYVNHELGPFVETSNKLDVALNRPNSFFMVDTNRGTRFTRNGNFSLDENGALVTKSGEAIMAVGSSMDNPKKITIPSNSVYIVIDSDGNVKADDVSVGKIQLVQVNNVQYLRKQGNNLYVPPSDEERIEFLNTDKNTGFIRQGFLEKSNVEAITQMTDLIETHRSIEMYQKVMQTHMDDLNSEAINKLASYKS
jgi:flagellar basal-body rod protein FlgG